VDFSKLREGDVLLFTAKPGNFTSWAICYLTGAPVSHAAIYYDADQNTMIEELEPSIEESELDFEHRFSDRKMFVRRLNDATLDLAPVLEAAKGYLNDEEPYAEAGLYLVGLLLIYKKFTPSGWLQKVTIKILKKLTLTVTKFLDSKEYPDKLPMFCSQFVAQCYEDAGEDYTLEFKDPILKSASGTKHLLDRTLERMEGEKDLEKALQRMAPSEDLDQTSEELCEELKRALEEIDGNETEGEIEEELHNAIVWFTHAHHQRSMGEKPLEELTKQHIHRALRYQKAMEPLFVSPGDLYENCTNLHEIDTSL